MNLADLLIEAEKRGCLDIAMRVAAACIRSNDYVTSEEQARLDRVRIISGQKGAKNAAQADCSGENCLQVTISTDAAAGYGQATRKEA